MLQCQFQLITGETPAKQMLNKMLLVSYGLQGLFLICFLMTAAHFLVSVVGLLLGVSIVGLAILEFAGIKLYQTEGVIKLDAAGISLNDLAMPATDLLRVEVKFNSPRGQGRGRNGIGDKGNRISIYPKASGEAVVATVLVEVRAQRDNLARVLKEWRKMGIQVSADGIDLA